MGLIDELRSALAPERVLARSIDRIAWANDASVYRLVPRVVVTPRDVDEVRRLIRIAADHEVPLTFRTAGTSLSGQAVTDGVLAVVSRHWRGFEILDDGARVRVQPGVIGGDLNRLLRPYGRKLGPDPASIDACMLGGILANNSSGMCCGTEQNAYRTLEWMRCLLADGTLIDSSVPDADERLRADAPELAAGLAALRRSVLDDAELLAAIRRKYAMKNTMGYSLNALVDFERPVEIATHLMIGSEGTLGFIAEAGLRTVADDPLALTGLLCFDSVPAACAAIDALRGSGARALELMDRASLRAIESQPGVPAGLRALGEGAAALLVEYQAADVSALDAFRETGARVAAALPLTEPAELTDDRERRAALWRVRKGLIPSVGARRRPGTSFIIEDVVFPVPRLADGVRGLQVLFARHGYDDAIVFGHAKDGNLHFVLTQAFDDPRDVARYDSFMRELAQLVAVDHGGALKAEHGTGRNMAPFVETEWGPAALETMRRIKRLFDPRGVLNPGVILNDDPRAHVTHLKDLPAVDADVDRCIECGFCERRCPSRDLTLTPRQRIVVRREIARADAPTRRELEHAFRYDGLATCAADGMCATTCPVSIDTGALVKRLRARRRTAGAGELARLAATHLAGVERIARAGLHVARWTGIAGRVGGGLPRAACARPSGPSDAAVAICAPSCVTRTIASAGPEEPSLPESIVRVAARAGVPTRIPEDVAGRCCGLAFASRGFERAAREAGERFVDAAWGWSEAGRLPVVLDISPCAEHLTRAAATLSPRSRRRLERLQILDPVAFAERFVLPRAALRPIEGEVAVHAVCSLRRAGEADALRRVASCCADGVAVVESVACCGFGGDRGFFAPELTASAARPGAAELAGRASAGCFSSSTTCELGLSRASGRRWRSIWSLLDRVVVGEEGAVVR